MSKALFLIFALAFGVALTQSEDTAASVGLRPATSPTVFTDVHTRRESGVGKVAATGHYETRCNGNSCQRVWVPDAPTVASPGPIKRATFSPTASRQRSIVVRRSRGCRSCR